MACGTSDAAEPPPPPPARSGADIGAQRAAADTSTPGRGTITPSDDPDLRPPWVQGGGGGGGGGRFPERQGRPMMTPEEAQQAARAAANEPADDGTPCAQAYAALASFSADFQKRTPWVPRSTPDRDEFMDGCRSLPQAQQQCLVPSYQRGHEDECRAALGGRGEPGGGTTP